MSDANPTPPRHPGTGQVQTGPIPPAWSSGHGQLIVDQREGDSYIREIGATNPLKLLISQADGRAAWVFGSTFGGGLVAGDRISLDIQVRSGARAFVGTQSSTKIYRSDHGAVVDQQLSATIAANGLLVHLPDPVTAFTRARFHQRQVIDLAADASVAWLDGCTAGRLARDERWAFSEWDSRLSVTVAGRPRFLDRLQLSHGRSSVADRFGRFNAMATLVVGGPLLLDRCARILDAVNAHPVTRDAPLLITAASIGSDAWGVAVRIIAIAQELIDRTVRDLMGDPTDLLGDDPWRRRP